MVIRDKLDYILAYIYITLHACLHYMMMIIWCVISLKTYFKRCIIHLRVLTITGLFCTLYERVIDVFMTCWW